MCRHRQIRRSRWRRRGPKAFRRQAACGCPDASGPPRSRSRVLRGPTGVSAANRGASLPRYWPQHAWPGSRRSANRFPVPHRSMYSIGVARIWASRRRRAGYTDSRRSSKREGDTAAPSRERCPQGVNEIAGRSRAGTYRVRRPGEPGKLPRWETMAARYCADAALFGVGIVRAPRTMSTDRRALRMAPVLAPINDWLAFPSKRRFIQKGEDDRKTATDEPAPHRARRASRWCGRDIDALSENDAETAGFFVDHWLSNLLRRCVLKSLFVPMNM